MLFPTPTAAHEFYLAQKAEPKEPEPPIKNEMQRRTEFIDTMTKAREEAARSAAKR